MDCAAPAVSGRAPGRVRRGCGLAATVVLVLRNRRVGHRQATLGEHFAQAWQGLLEGIARFDMLGTEPQAHL